MMENEQPEGLSARKLVVETAKHNVITAYKRETGLELLRRFPKVDVVLLHASILREYPLIDEVREIAPGMPVIVAAPKLTRHFEGATWVVSSHEPQALLDLLVREFGITASSEAA